MVTQNGFAQILAGSVASASGFILQTPE